MNCSTSTLEKFLSASGLCSLEELDEVENFLEDLKKRLDIYVSAAGYVPLGYTINHHLDIINYLRQIKDTEQ